MVGISKAELESFFGKVKYKAQPDISTRMPNGLYLWESSREDLIRSVLAPHREGDVKIIKTYAHRLVGNVLWACQHRRGLQEQTEEQRTPSKAQSRNTIACYLIGRSMPRIPYIEVVEESDFPVYMNCPAEFLDFKPESGAQECRNEVWRGCVRIVHRAKAVSPSPEYYLADMFWSLRSVVDGWWVFGGEVSGPGNKRISEEQRKAAERKRALASRLEAKDYGFLKDFIEEWSPKRGRSHAVPAEFLRSLDIEVMAEIARQMQKTPGDSSSPFDDFWRFYAG